MFFFFICFLNEATAGTPKGWNVCKTSIVLDARCTDQPTPPVLQQHVVSYISKAQYKAEKHIQQLTYNFKNGFTRKHHVRDLSWVTFTDPEVASFGYTEKELKKQKINYWRQDQYLHDDDRAIVGEYAYGKMTLFLTPKSVWGGQRRILGGSLIATNAGEIIQELLLAANEGISAEAFIKNIYPYPTASRINQQTIKGVMAEDAKRWF